MAQTPSQFTVGKLYQNVIDDVVAGVRDSFLDEGVDEQALTELRMLWESKLWNSKAVENGQFPGDLALTNNGTSTNAKQGVGAGAGRSAGQLPQHQPPQSVQAAVNSVRTDGPAAMSIVPIQITMPRQPNDPPHIQKTITVNVPASCIHNDKLQEILSLPHIQATLSLPTDEASRRLQEQVDAALAELGRGAAGSVIRNNSRRPPRGSNALAEGFVQVDGQTGDDTSDEEDEEDIDDEDLDDDDDKDDDNLDEEQEEGQDEEPLNTDDDLSGDEDSNEKLYEVDNVVVCQYDKITRARNKWKFHFKDGIMNLNGKDYVFQKANGDAEW